MPNKKPLGHFLSVASPLPTPDEPHDWLGSSSLPAKAFVCGHCGNSVSSNTGYLASAQGQTSTSCWKIYICHHCLKPTFMGHDEQVPGPAFGSNVEHIESAEVAGIYDEARACYTACAYTAAVMCARKVLMNVAVSRGAKEGQSFVSYVRFLTDKKLIPEEAGGWVENLKDAGNDANHLISLFDEHAAKRQILCTEMLLKLVYEFPERAREQ